MSIVLPKHLEDWAKAEVQAGRASSIESLAEQALESHRRQVEVFRASLERAIGEADRDGWLEGDVVLAEMDSMIDTLEREAASGK